MKKENKDKIQKEIDNLKDDISSYTDSNTINNILKSKKEIKREYIKAKKNEKFEYKKVKKEHFKNTSIRNLIITGEILLIMAPTALCGGVTFQVMDNNGVRPYVNDTTINYAYIETEADTEGKFNEQTTYSVSDPSFKYTTPWKEKDGVYVRETFEYNKDLFKNMTPSEIVKLDDEIIEKKIDKNQPKTHKLETKQELTNEELKNNNSYIYSKKAITDPTNYTERVNSVSDTVEFSILHVLLTAASTVLTYLIMLGIYIKVDNNLDGTLDNYTEQKKEYYDERYKESKIKLKEAKNKYKSLKK